MKKIIGLIVMFIGTIAFAACSGRYSTDVEDLIGAWRLEPRTFIFHEDGTGEVWRDRVLEMAAELVWEDLGDGKIGIEQRSIFAGASQIDEYMMEFRIKEDTMIRTIIIHEFSAEETLTRVVDE